MADSHSHDELRAAFERLDTQQKTAFILQATFDTIGKAIGETGERVANAVREFDLEGCFRAWDAKAGRAAQDPPSPAAGPASAPSSRANPGAPADPLEPPVPPPAP